MCSLPGRRQDKLGEALKLIGQNVTAVRGDASSLADLDRLYATVKKEKGRIDVLSASAGFGEFAKIGEITEKHFDKTFDLNVRGTLFTVQKALNPREFRRFVPIQTPARNFEGPT